MAEMDPAELEAIMVSAGKLSADLESAGAFVHAGGLMPPSTAVTVDATGEQPIRTSEPFVEATEYVGGFWIVNAADGEATCSDAGRRPPYVSSG